MPNSLPMANRPPDHDLWSEVREIRGNMAGRDSGDKSIGGVAS